MSARSGGTAVEQRNHGGTGPLLQLRARGGAVLGLGVGGCGMVNGMRGIRGVLNKGRRVTWACVPREGRGEIPGGDRGLPLRARGEGKGMTLLSGSGQAVRRGGRSVGARRAGACVGAGRWQVGPRRGKGEGDAVQGAGLCASACWAARGVRLGQEGSWAGPG